VADLCLVHWQADEAAERAARLEALGYSVMAPTWEGPGAGGALMRALRAAQPRAYLIDLGRLPSHGREVATALRGSGKTRQIPLVFVDGAPDKVARIQSILPDATYATWANLADVLPGVLAGTPREKPLVVPSTFEVYQRRSVKDKLGVKDGMRVAVHADPGHAAELIGENAHVVGMDAPDYQLTLFFARSLARYQEALPTLLARSHEAPVWVIWPKQASGVATDLRESEVRIRGIEAGMVDYKICAVDAIWSGMLFAPRR
jgi:CheY-like chemotaxis protein